MKPLLQDVAAMTASVAVDSVAKVSTPIKTAYNSDDP